MTLAAVFGSYVTHRDATVGDLDVLLYLLPWHEGPAQDAAERDALRRARRAGIRLRSAAARIHWPREELLRFLRARSPVFSFHDWRIDAGIAFLTPQTRVVFAEHRPAHPLIEELTRKAQEAMLRPPPNVTPRR